MRNCRAARSASPSSPGWIPSRRCADAAARLLGWRAGARRPARPARASAVSSCGRRRRVSSRTTRCGPDSRDRLGARQRHRLGTRRSPGSGRGIRVRVLLHRLRVTASASRRGHRCRDDHLHPGQPCYPSMSMSMSRTGRSCLRLSQKCRHRMSSSSSGPTAIVRRSFVRSSCRIAALRIHLGTPLPGRGVPHYCTWDSQQADSSRTAHSGVPHTKARGCSHESRGASCHLHRDTRVTPPVPERHATIVCVRPLS